MNCLGDVLPYKFDETQEDGKKILREMPFFPENRVGFDAAQKLLQKMMDSLPGEVQSRFEAAASTPAYMA